MVEKIIFFLILCTINIFANQAYKVVGVKDNDTLSVREHPTSNSIKINTLDYNAKDIFLISCTKIKKSTWCQLEDASAGWVNKRYLKKTTSRHTSSEDVKIAQSSFGGEYFQYLTFVSKDDTWSSVNLNGKHNTCDLSIRWSPIHGERVLGNSDRCIFLKNTQGDDIVCTKDKSICKTLDAVKVFSDKQDITSTSDYYSIPDQSEKIYTLNELYGIVNHKNTDLTNKKIEKSLIGKPVSGICMVTEVDEDSYGKGYHVQCEAPSGQVLKLLTDNLEQIEHLRRGESTKFTGTIKSIKAENDYFKIKSLYINL